MRSSGTANEGHKFGAEEVFNGTEKLNFRLRTDRIVCIVFTKALVGTVEKNLSC